MAIIEAIETIRLEATTASVSFSSFAGYEHLQIRYSAGCEGSTGSNWQSIAMQFNDDTGSNYTYRQLYAFNSNYGTFGSGENNTRTGFITTYESAGHGTGGAPEAYGGGVVLIPDYLNANKNTVTQQAGGVGMRKGSGARGIYGITNAVWDDTSALTKITLSPQTDDWVTGTTFTLYGIKSS